MSEPESCTRRDRQPDVWSQCNVPLSVITSCRLHTCECMRIQRRVRLRLSLTPPGLRVVSVVIASGPEDSHDFTHLNSVCWRDMDTCIFLLNCKYTTSTSAWCSFNRTVSLSHVFTHILQNQKQLCRWLLRHVAENTFWGNIIQAAIMQWMTITTCVVKWVTYRDNPTKEVSPSL